MISVRRTYLWVLMLCFTFSYLLSYVPTPAFSAMLVMVAAGVLFAGYTLQQKKAGWNVPLLVMTLWMLCMQFVRDPSPGSLVTIVYRCVAGFVSFTLLSSIGRDSVRSARKHRMFIGAIAVIFVFWFASYVLSVAGQRTARNWGYANYVYMLFALFPFSFFFRKKLWRYAFFGLLVVAAVLSLKRTAFILLCMYALLYLVYSFRHQRLNKRMFWLLLLVFGAVLYVLLFTDIFQQFAEKYLYRFANVEEDNMGGRLDIWKAGLGMWWNGGFIPIMVGTDYTYEGLSMHNDYIEMLVTYGVIGLLTMLAVLFRFLKEYKAVRRTGIEPLKKAYAFSLANFAILMLVSHVIVYPYMMFLCTMPLGYCCGLRYRRRIKK